MFLYQTWQQIIKTSVKRSLQLRLFYFEILNLVYCIAEHWIAVTTLKIDAAQLQTLQGWF